MDLFPQNHVHVLKEIIRIIRKWNFQTWAVSLVLTSCMPRRDKTSQGIWECPHKIAHRHRNASSFLDIIWRICQAGGIWSFHSFLLLLQKLFTKCPWRMHSYVLNVLFWSMNRWTVRLSFSLREIYGSTRVRGSSYSFDRVYNRTINYVTRSFEGDTCCRKFI